MVCVSSSGRTCLEHVLYHLTDVRQTDVRQHHRLMPTPIRGGGITSCAVCPPPVTLTFDLLTLKVVSECDMGSLCANFGLPRHFCSRLRPDVRDRQTDVAECPLGAGA